MQGTRPLVVETHATACNLEKLTSGFFLPPFQCPFAGFVLTSSGSGPSRFSQEPCSMRRRPSGSSDDGDPANAPGHSRQNRAAVPRQQQQDPRQQLQQQQQAWQVAPHALPAYHHFEAAFVTTKAELDAEQAPARHQYRGVSRHR